MGVAELLVAKENHDGLLGYPGRGSKCHGRIGRCQQESHCTGPNAIALKQTNELGSGGARDFLISAESYSVHFYTTTQ